MINPFVPNAHFLYPMKTSENRKVFWRFQGVEKGALGMNGLKISKPFWRYKSYADWVSTKWEIFTKWIAYREGKQFIKNFGQPYKILVLKFS